MARSIPAFRLLVPLFVVVTLGCAAACRARGESGGAVVDWELRSYEVPAGDREQLVDILGSLLKDKGRVRLGPDGRLLVLAAPSTHKDIKNAVLDRLPAGRTQAPPPSLSITYWMVLARKAPGGAAPTSPPAALQEIGAALKEIERTTGGAELTLVERLRVSSLPGVDARTEGRAFSVHQKAALAGATVVSDLSIDGQLSDGSGIHRRDILRTRVSLRPGQLAVVGEAGLSGQPRGLAPNPKGEGENTLFIILRASVDDASVAGK